METLLISVNPCFFTPLGHNYYYLQAVEQACKNIDWKFTALLPKKNIVQNLPPHWKKELDLPTVKVCYQEIEKKTYRRERKVVRARMRTCYYYSLLKALRVSMKKNRSDRYILFYEAFSLSDLKLITNLLKGLFFKNIELWVVLRYPSSFFKQDVLGYQKLFKKLGTKIKLICDTELLQQDLSSCFQRPVALFPIPLPDHIYSQSTMKPSTDRVKCWWPGLVREGKGLKIIQDFAASTNEHNKLIELLAAKNANLVKNKQGPRLNLLETHLPKEEYDHHLKESHFILMPYCDPCYEKTSSNIFTETILAGKIPLVYPNTWMSYELAKFDLSELVLDWQCSEMSRQIIQIFKQPNLLSRLEKLQKHYKKFHNVASYSSQMLALSQQ